MKCLWFASCQREGRSGEPGVPSILLPAAGEQSPEQLQSLCPSGTAMALGQLGARAAPRVLRGTELGGSRASPFSVIQGHKLSSWAVSDAWDKDHRVGIAEPWGISGAPISFVLQQNASCWPQITTDVAKPSAGNWVDLTSLLAAGPRGSCRGCSAAWNRRQSTAASSRTPSDLPRKLSAPMASVSVLPVLSACSAFSSWPLTPQHCFDAFV